MKERKPRRSRIFVWVEHQREDVGVLVRKRGSSRLRKITYYHKSLVLNRWPIRVMTPYNNDGPGKTSSWSFTNTYIHICMCVSLYGCIYAYICVCVSVCNYRQFLKLKYDYVKIKVRQSCFIIKGKDINIKVGKRYKHRKKNCHSLDR